MPNAGSGKCHKASGQQADAKPTSAIDNSRLTQLIELHGDTESNIIRDALTLKWYVDIGFENLQNVQLLQREVDIITNHGQNDP